jgi:hypothetical protein
MNWINLDFALRATGVDPDEFARKLGMIVIADDDGNGWWGTATRDRDAAVADYVASGGTATTVYDGAN